MSQCKLLTRNLYRKSRQCLDKYGIVKANPDISETFNSGSRVGCDAYNCVFIHIPKTGGMSICKDLGVRNNHMTAEEWRAINPELFNSYFKFTFVRDPVKRLVSCYRYLCFSLPSEAADIELGQFILSNYCNIDHFIMDGLEALLDHLLFKHQYKFLYDANGINLVDFIGKIENFENDRTKVYQHIGVTVRKNTKRNVSQGENLELHLDSIKKLRAIYSEDINLFDY